MKGDTTWLTEESTGEYLCDLGMGDDFLDFKIVNYKAIFGEFGQIKINDFLLIKDSMDNVKS